jgi:hypothetical protein
MNDSRGTKRSNLRVGLILLAVVLLFFVGVIVNRWVQ